MTSPSRQPAPDTRVRLQKAISAAGLMSRRAAENLIAQGRVTIDGRPARLGDRVDPANSMVVVDGAPLPLAPHLVTYLVNKPPGVTSTTADPHASETVVDLVPDYPRVWPVGRLDRRSEGLILVSNDGELTNLVTHPRYGVSKTYRALVEGVPPAGHRPPPDPGSGVGGRDGPGVAGPLGGPYLPGGPVGTGDGRGTEPGDPADDGGGRPSGAQAGESLDRTVAGRDPPTGAVAPTVEPGGGGALPGRCAVIGSAWWNPTSPR